MRRTMTTTIWTRRRTRTLRSSSPSRWRGSQWPRNRQPLLLSLRSQPWWPSQRQRLLSLLRLPLLSPRPSLRSQNPCLWRLAWPAASSSSLSSRPPRGLQPPMLPCRPQRYQQRPLSLTTRTSPRRLRLRSRPGARWPVPPGRRCGGGMIVLCRLVLARHA